MFILFVLGSETSETDLNFVEDYDIKSNPDFIITSSDDFDSSDESEKCETESYSTTDETLSASNPTYDSVVKVIPGPGDLSQTLENGPKQPKLVCYPKTKYVNRMRHFSPNWYKIHNWIEYSIIDDSIFCFPC